MRLEWLRNLVALEEVNLANNQIKALDSNEFRDYFPSLATLNLSYNRINERYINELAVLPVLENLSLAGNELAALPDSMKGFARLKRLELGSNMFSSDQKASLAWGCLATIPLLSYLSIERNQLRGIHT